MSVPQYPPMPPQGYPQQGNPPQGQPPQNYLAWAIVATILCCWPLGIPAIIFATQVNTKWMQGDYQGAMDASKKAKNFSIWSAVAAAALVVVYVLFFVIIGISASTYN